MRHLSLFLLAGVVLSSPAFAATSAQPSNQQQPQQQQRQPQQPARSPLPAQEPRTPGPTAGYGGMFIHPDIASQHQPPRTPIWPVFQIEQSGAGGSGGLALKTSTARIEGLTADRTVTPVFQIDARPDTAIEMHEDVVGTTESYIAGKHYDGPFSLKAMAIPADVVKRGDVTTHVWACNKSPHLVHVAAYVTDAQGNRSNEVRFTIRCNGA